MKRISIVTPGAEYVDQRKSACHFARNNAITFIVTSALLPRCKKRRTGHMMKIIAKRVGSVSNVDKLSMK